MTTNMHHITSLAHTDEEAFGRWLSTTISAMAESPLKATTMKRRGKRGRGHWAVYLEDHRVIRVWLLDTKRNIFAGVLEGAKLDKYPYTTDMRNSHLRVGASGYTFQVKAEYLITQIAKELEDHPAVEFKAMKHELVTWTEIMMKEYGEMVRLHLSDPSPLFEKLYVEKTEENFKAIDDVFTFEVEG